MKLDNHESIKGGQWICFNDENFYKVDFKLPYASCAVLNIFYRRIG